MNEHVPDIYTSYRDRFPEVTAATDALGIATAAAGPLDERERRLVTLGIAIGREAEGAVRSNARKALDLGVSPQQLHHVAMLAISTAGFPAAIAGLQWIDEVLAARAER
ncbi:MAG: carboxymuconolactone decarboxylase family protein [Nitriliruptoraceae bacterium]